MNKEDMYKFLFEAPGDEDEPTTDAPAEDAPTDEAPPDMNTTDEGGTDVDVTDDPGDNGPPDIDMGNDDFDSDFSSDEGSTENISVPEKISAILNVNLYKNFMKLISDIGTQLNTIKHNIDMFNALTPTTSDTVDQFHKLDENVRLYMTTKFRDERYENNQLFYDKCKTLYQFLNEKFGKEINKGIKNI